MTIIEHDAPQPERHLPIVQTPMQMLGAALERGMDPEKLKALMDLADRHEANEARKAYAEAMVRFKANPPRIGKNAVVDFTSSKGRTHYKHATLDNVNDLISAGLQQVGIAAAWKTEQPDGLVRVTCTLTHVLGHSESVTLQAPKDESGNKNSIQAVVSTVTYLERQTLLSVSGMAVSNTDDDGGGGEGILLMKEADKLLLHAKIEEVADVKGAEALWADIASTCAKVGDIPAYDELKAAMNRKVKALKAAA